MLWDVDIGGEGDDWTVSLTPHDHPSPDVRGKAGVDR